MLFTATSPAHQGDQIHLYFTIEEARAVVGEGRPIYGVAVHYDGLRHRLLPLDSGAVGPDWTVPARFQHGGPVVAPAPLPRPLFLG